MRRAARMWLALALVGTMTGQSLAQTQILPPAAAPRPARPPTATPPRPAPPAVPEAPEPPPPPYERTLLRLAEVMGSVAVLKDLCAEPDANEWRAKMAAILDVEGTTPGRRERLAGAYNRGFRSFTLTYRTCTDSAREALSRYIQEGAALTRELKSRYSE